MAGGKLWFTAQQGAIGMVDPANPSSITTYSHGLPTNADPNVITTGRDGNIWFTDFHSAVGVVTLATPTPTPTPAPSTPLIDAASVLTTQPTRRGKPFGKPLLSGYQFHYNAAVNASTAGNPGNYLVQTYVQVTVRSHGRRIKVLQLQPVGIRVEFNQATSTVQLTLSGKRKFTRGGQITLIGTPPSGISSAAGAFLVGNDSGPVGSNALFAIARGGGSIRRL